MITVMKDYRIYFLVFVFLLFIASTCKKDENCPEGSHKNIYIKNDSGTALNWVNGDFGADSIWHVQGSPSFDASFRLLPSNSIDVAGAGLVGCWDYYYSSSTPIYFFFFNNDTVRALGWTAINGTNRGLLKNVKVDLNYLEANNFTIAYP